MERGLSRVCMSWLMMRNHQNARTRFRLCLRLMNKNFHFSEFEKFKKLLRTIHVIIQFPVLILECPVYNKLFKDVMTENISTTSYYNGKS